MRTVPLTKLKAGISLIRTKGGASPDALKDLLNGYLTTSQTLQSRPGSVRKTSGSGVAGTVGLFAFNGTYYVFGDHPQAVPAGFKLGILRHPTSPTATLAAVPFVGVMFGRLYVAATFSDGATFHFWLEGDFLPVWTASTQHQFADRVVPTVPTGYVYQIANLDMSPAWTVNTAYKDAASGSVQPSTYNGFRYTGVPSKGFPFTTGDVEPKWPTVEAATVTERRYTQSELYGTGNANPQPPKPPPRGEAYQ